MPVFAGGGGDHPVFQHPARGRLEHIAQQQAAQRLRHGARRGGVEQRIVEIGIGLVAVGAGGVVADALRKARQCGRAARRAHQKIGGGVVAGFHDGAGQRADAQTSLAQVAGGDRRGRQHVAGAIGQRAAELFIARIDAGQNLRRQQQLEGRGHVETFVLAPAHAFARGGIQGEHAQPPAMLAFDGGDFRRKGIGAAARLGQRGRGGQRHQGSKAEPAVHPPIKPKRA